jgi:hypothetical protein
MAYSSKLKTYHNMTHRQLSKLVDGNVSETKLSKITHLLNNTNEHKYAQNKGEFLSVVGSYLTKIETLQFGKDKKQMALKLYDYLVANIHILPVEIPSNRKLYEVIYNKALTLEKENPEFGYYKYYLNDHLKNETKKRKFEE